VTVRVPLFGSYHIEQAVPTDIAVEVVCGAFLAHYRGAWKMPPKVYVTNYPAGDFRAMPALGGGHALLKWINSFPGNPERGLPTVSGVVLLSNAETGELEAVLDAAAVTSRRTGAAAVLAAETLGRRGARTAAVIGAGINGSAAARMLVERGHVVTIWDVDQARAARAAEELGASLGASLEEALGADLLVTVTPGRTVLLTDGSLAPGQHVSLMGADGPGKAEISATELARTRIFCDDWEQASHGGELAQVVGAGLIGRGDVELIGAVLAGEAEGRRDEAEITTFDSTGLAIQDLAIAIACFEQSTELDLPTLDL
jgi:alanine dehydrogenase